MDAIFHEKQEGSLCAQHCLNALLQNQYFSAVDLAQIGTRLDERERERMAEGGIRTNEYQRFIEEPSSNYDDSGFFSVQVITEALSVWGLEMVLYNSSDAVAVNARQSPTQMTAFICNFQQHWFCIRKLGLQWFNLNSLLSGPELISDTYLALFLTQLQQEGYSIFIVTGQLPECEADELLRLMPATQTVKPKLLSEEEAGQQSKSQSGGLEDDDDDSLREALRVSKEILDNDDTALQKALQASMEGYYLDTSNTSNSVGHSQARPGDASTSQELVAGGAQAPASQQELREKRLAFLNRTANHGPDTTESTEKSTIDTGQHKGDNDQTELTEEELLQQAISMSMENS